MNDELGGLVAAWCRQHEPTDRGLGYGREHVRGQERSAPWQAAMLPQPLTPHVVFNPVSVGTRLVPLAKQLFCGKLVSATARYQQHIRRLERLIG